MYVALRVSGAGKGEGMAQEKHGAARRTMCGSRGSRWSVVALSALIALGFGVPLTARVAAAGTVTATVPTARPTTPPTATLTRTPPPTTTATATATPTATGMPGARGAQPLVPSTATGGTPTAMTGTPGASAPHSPSTTPVAGALQPASGTASATPSGTPTATGTPTGTPKATPGVVTVTVTVVAPTNVPATPPPPPVPTLDLSGLQILDDPGIGGNALIARTALRHYGEFYRPDGAAWVGWCEMFVGDVLAEAGVPHARYASAILDAIDGPLYRGRAPAGSVVYFDQRASPYGHVGIALGDGTMLSALGGGIVRTTYEDWASYLGWRPYGATAPDEGPVTILQLAEAAPASPENDTPPDLPAYDEPRWYDPPPYRTRDDINK